MAIHTVFFDLGDTLVTVAPKGWLPGAKAILTNFKQQGFRFRIISNTGNLSSRQAILSLLPTDFDTSIFESGLVLLSSEVALAKRFYETLHSGRH